MGLHYKFKQRFIEPTAQAGSQCVRSNSVDTEFFLLVKTSLSVYGKRLHFARDYFSRLNALAKPTTAARNCFWWWRSTGNTHRKASKNKRQNIKNIKNQTKKTDGCRFFCLCGFTKADQQP